MTAWGKSLPPIHYDTFAVTQPLAECHDIALEFTHCKQSIHNQATLRMLSAKKQCFITTALGIGWKLDFTFEGPSSNSSTHL
ncbi:jg8044 [Pararge aegeria aegeria]|uniref:Jg8044 protein n=1 Tax=Pararge aegeria aegeria TaxID=348720 RepID=A0A8S4RG14_9NEOP|nr:jg8044 [Pararge aegeria aegeria]